MPILHAGGLGLIPYPAMPAVALSGNDLTPNSTEKKSKGMDEQVLEKSTSYQLWLRASLGVGS